MYIHFPKNPISFTFNTFSHLVVSEKVSIFASSMLQIGWIK